MDNFKNKLRITSGLDFTHEEAQDEQLQFLDLKLKKIFIGNFLTFVYTKPAKNGLYANSASHTYHTYIDCTKSVVKI